MFKVLRSAASFFNLFSPTTLKSRNLLSVFNSLTSFFKAKSNRQFSIFFPLSVSLPFQIHLYRFWCRRSDNVLQTMGNLLLPGCSVPLQVYVHFFTRYRMTFFPGRPSCPPTMDPADSQGGLRKVWEAVKQETCSAGSFGGQQ